MTSTWTAVREGVEICPVPADSIVFKQKTYYSFLQIESVGVTKLVIFCERHKSMTPQIKLCHVDSVWKYTYEK